MKCPHCLVEFHDDPKNVFIGRDKLGEWWLETRYCPNPACKKIIIFLCCGTVKIISPVGGFIPDIVYKYIMVYPKGISREPLPPEVPKEFAEDYSESCLVLSDSAKASAALSRRCLQSLLREVAKVKPGDLSMEIQEVINSGKLPSYISELIDAVRNIGNFAAHPVKSKSSGEILPVEPGEAELNLDVLEALFDFYFVQPALIQKKKDALNQKLKDAGKPEMK